VHLLPVVVQADRMEPADKVARIPREVQDQVEAAMVAVRQEAAQEVPETELMGATIHRERVMD